MSGRLGARGWWRAVAVVAAAVTALALVTLAVVAPRGSSPSEPGAGDGLSLSALSAIGTLLGDRETLRSQRTEIRRSLERRSDELPPGAAESVLEGLTTLDGALEKLTVAWRDDPTNVEVVVEIARMWRLRSRLVGRAETLLRRAAGDRVSG